MQLDEMWSFVGKKQNKQWIWLALNAETHENAAVYIGDSSRHSAQRLWHSLHAVYRQYALAYTDFLEAYQNVLPRKRPHTLEKETGKNDLHRAL